MSLFGFICPRNGIAGAQVSEHGHVNALDVRSFKLSNGGIIGLNNASVAKSLREKLRDSACARFPTVLDNGADAYHDTHVICQPLHRGRAWLASGSATATCRAKLILPAQKFENANVSLVRRRSSVNRASVGHGKSFHGTWRTYCAEFSRPVRSPCPAMNSRRLTGSPRRRCPTFFPGW
jgi:hypothetical protein